MSYGAIYEQGYRQVGTYCFRVRLINPMLPRLQGGPSPEQGASGPRVLMQSDLLTPVAGTVYRQWRYVDNPKAYEFISYSEMRSKADFVVRRNRRSHVNELILLDSQFSSYSERFLERAIRHLDRAYSRKVAYVRTFVSESAERGIAMKKFFPLRFKSKYHILAVKPVSERLSLMILLNSNRWDVMPHLIDDL